MTLQKNELISVAIAAQRLRVSPQRVKELIGLGRLPARKLPGTNIWLIRAADLRLLRGRRPGRPSG